MDGNGGLWFDAAAFGRLRAELRAVPADGPPAARLLGVDQAARHLVVVSGSFNPLTSAHLSLAEAAAARFSGASVVWLLSTLTTEKPHSAGAALDDRLMTLLRQPSASGAPRGALLVNRGLYVEQAALLRAAFPEAQRLTFAAGFDKAVQIFDARYYQRRDAALDELFSLADLAIAPRDQASADDLSALITRPENRRYAPLVTLLPMPRQLAEVSSSGQRAALAQDQPAAELAPAAAWLVAATGAYRDERPDGLYAARRRLLDEALRQGQPYPSPAALRSRWLAAAQPSP